MPQVTDIAQKKSPIVLTIIDGWGLSPAWGGNAIAMSEPSTMNELWRTYPHAVLQAFRKVAGPGGKVGSSEIGHASLGSGRVVEQDLTEISLAIDSGLFFKNPVLVEAMAQAKDCGKSVHLMGLLSDGGIHAMIDHALALVEMASQQSIDKLWLHVFTDGRDVETNSALRYIHTLESKLTTEGRGRIATVMGRYYGMDRDNHIERIEAAYNALVLGKGRRASTAQQAISSAYRDGFNDERIPPTIIDNGRIEAGDSVIFWNFRADRARQITQALVDPKSFRSFFKRKFSTVKDLRMVTMTDYHLKIPGLKVAFPSAVIENNLASILADHNLEQLHMAESEKYAHVTYFFNGGREEPYEGEDRFIVPSPRVDSYAQTPAMSLPALTDKLVKAIRLKSHDFIVVNFANVDMVGHTGNVLAAGKAVGYVDEAIRRVVNSILDVNGILLITADHGNAESVVTLAQGDRETLHTLNPVPFIYVARGAQRRFPNTPELNRLTAQSLNSRHTLADVAPTILELMNLAKPSDMTGQSLIDHLE